MHKSNGLGFVDPNQVLEKLSVEAGQVVADFGAGSGYFSCAFAQQVGPEGKVVALDILPSSLEAIASRARTTGVSNVEARRANLEREGGSGIDPHSVDWVIIKDILFQNSHKEVILYEAARILKIGGRLFVMEWNPDAAFVGPENNLRVDKRTLQEMLTAAGFAVLEEISVGEYHYAFVAEKRN